MNTKRPGSLSHDGGWLPRLIPYRSSCQDRIGWIRIKISNTVINIYWFLCLSPSKPRFMH